MSNDVIFGLIFIASMIIGIIWSFWLSYRIVKFQKKEHPDLTFNINDVFNQQYELGGPLVLFPLIGVVLDIMMEIFFYVSTHPQKRNIIKEFLHKEIR